MSFENFRAKKALITGGLGFIGSNLALRLVELGVDVTIVDSLIPEYGGNLANIEPVKEQLRINISDIRDEHALQFLVRGQDYLFNLAGQTSHLDSMTDPYTDLDINCRSQLSILETCRKNNAEVKIIFASTRQIYGAPQYLPVDEGHPIKPVDVNGINKMAGERYHLLYHQVHGIRACALRLTNTYGPRMRIKDARQTFLGVWIRDLLRDEPLQVFGDGKQVRDFNFVDDVVDALLLAALSDASAGKIFNLGADNPISLRETAELMVELHGSGSYEIVPFPPERKAIDIGDYYGDYRQIAAQLGWKPATTLRDGMQKTLDYYGTHLAEYV